MDDNATIAGDFKVQSSGNRDWKSLDSGHILKEMLEDLMINRRGLLAQAIRRMVCPSTEMWLLYGKFLALKTHKLIPLILYSKIKCS